MLLHIVFFTIAIVGCLFILAGCMMASMICESPKCSCQMSAAITSENTGAQLEHSEEVESGPNPKETPASSPVATNAEPVLQSGLISPTTPTPTLEEQPIDPGVALDGPRDQTTCTPSMLEEQPSIESVPPVTTLVSQVSAEGKRHVPSKISPPKRRTLSITNSLASVASQDPSSSQVYCIDTNISSSTLVASRPQSFSHSAVITPPSTHKYAEETASKKPFEEATPRPWAMRVVPFIRFKLSGLRPSIFSRKFRKEMGLGHSRSPSNSSTVDG